MRILADLRTSARHPWARAGLFACALSALLLAAATAFWWPAERSRAALEDEIAAARRAAAQARQAEELRAAYSRAAKEVALLEKKLDYAATQAQLVENFARLARRHAVKIVSETYDAGAPRAGSALSAELALQASYPALREFLRDLAALPSWSEVQEVRLESVHGSPVQKGRVRIVTYRKPAPARGKAS